MEQKRHKKEEKHQWRLLLLFSSPIAAGFRNEIKYTLKKYMLQNQIIIVIQVDMSYGQEINLYIPKIEAGVSHVYGGLSAICYTTICLRQKK